MNGAQQDSLPPEWTVDSPRWKLWAWTIVACGCTLAGVVLLLGGVISSGWLPWRAADPGDAMGSQALAGVGLLSIFVLAPIAAWSIGRLAQPRPAVRATREGLWNNTPFGFGLIAWEEVEELRVYNYLGSVFIAVVPKDPRAVLRRLPAWLSAMAIMNRAVGAQYFNIAQSLLPMKAKEALEVLEAYREQSQPQP